MAPTGKPHIRNKEKRRKLANRFTDSRDPLGKRLSLIPAGQEHLLQQEDGKKRFIQVVTELSRAFAPLRRQRRSDSHPR